MACVRSGDDRYVLSAVFGLNHVLYSPCIFVSMSRNVIL